jgi:hypothetical protein
MMYTDHDIFRAELRQHRGIAVVVGVIEGGVVDVGLFGHLLVTAFVVFIVFVAFVTIVDFALDFFICGERKNILSRLVVRGGFENVVAGGWVDNNVGRLVRGAQRCNAPPSRRPHRAIGISTSRRYARGNHVNVHVI